MQKKAFHKKLVANIELIKQELHQTGDLIVRVFTISFQKYPEIKGALCYLDGMASSATINSEILRPLLLDARRFDEPPDADILTYLSHSVLPAGELAEADDLESALLAIMSGEVVLLLDEIDRALTVDTKGWDRRGIEPSQTEAVIRGPRDAFTESISQNLMLVRRRIRDPNLVFHRMKIGQRGRNDIAVAYIEGIAKPELIAEVKNRLEKVDMDIILDSGYIEQIIEDDWWSPFNTLQDTERPDEVAAGLTEGRLAIIVDNTPFALLAPATFNTQMMSPEDYYVRWPAVNFIRIIRFVASFVALLTPALYIAVVAYHPEMLPTQLALSIAAAREGIPFPSFVEAVIMELALELLREAGLRLPGPIGQTIGIVGGLIVGDAAVRANLVSPVMVVVVALTAIAGFIIPTYSLGFGLRVTRFYLMFMAATLGLYGLTISLLVLLGHLATLTSFGVSFLSPWAPLNVHDLRDSIFRAPWHKLNNRPSFTEPLDQARQSRRSKKQRKARKR